MSDGSSKIGGNLPPPVPGANAPDVDESFLDDLVGAQLKGREAARKRASEGAPKSDPRDVGRQHGRVRETSSFSRSRQESDLERRGRRFNTKGREGEGLSRASGREVRHQGVETLARSEESVGELMHEIYSLLEQVDVLGGMDALDEAARAVLDKEGALRRGQDKDNTNLAGSIARLNTLNGKLKKAEMELKFQLQQLLAGSTGLLLLGDPRLTFKRLLSRIRRWPRRVRPGRLPATEEEFDAFLAWVFEPPTPPDVDGSEEYEAL